MKKVLFGMTVIASLLIFTVSTAFAKTGFSETKKDGGFSGPGLEVITVEQAKTMRDDSRVVLQGMIVQHMGGEKYLFKDETGSVVVEIDDEDWGGLNITPDDVVELYGKVDKDWNSIEIDIKRLKKI